MSSSLSLSMEDVDILKASHQEAQDILKARHYTHICTYTYLYVYIYIYTHTYIQ